MATPTYTYTSNVPQANQKISATQAPILSNFQAINEWIIVNHVGFNDGIYFGCHNATNFVEQDDDQTTSSTEMTLYSKATDDANGIEIYYRYPSDGTVVQLTGGGKNGSSSAASSGYAYLGSMIMQWGIATGIVADGSNTISFNLPYTTEVYVVHFTPAASYTISETGAYISSTSLTEFVLTTTGTMSTSVYWWAFGL